MQRMNFDGNPGCDNKSLSYAAVFSTPAFFTPAFSTPAFSATAFSAPSYRFLFAISAMVSRDHDSSFSFLQTIARCLFNSHIRFEFINSPSFAGISTDRIWCLAIWCRRSSCAWIIATTNQADCALSEQPDDVVGGEPLATLDKAPVLTWLQRRTIDVSPALVLSKNNPT